MTSPLKAETSILFLGDSLTAGYGVEQEQAYPSLLGPLIAAGGYPDVKLINAGISGSTTASALSRLKWYKRTRPDILFLALGANDGLRGLSLSAMEKHLDATIRMALDQGMTVILAGMEIPPNYGPAYTRQFRQVFVTLAEKYSIILMPFLLKGVAGRSQYNQADGIHPTAAGHRIIAANVLPYIVKELKGLDIPSSSHDN
ncbi:arylesterase [Desulfocicer niacini]